MCDIRGQFRKHSTTCYVACIVHEAGADHVPQKQLSQRLFTLRPTPEQGTCNECALFAELSQ